MKSATIRRNSRIQGVNANPQAGKKLCAGGNLANANKWGLSMPDKFVLFSDNDSRCRVSADHFPFRKFYLGPQFNIIQKIVQIIVAGAAAVLNQN